MQTQQIRRRDNGTIDIDNYRQEALLLRARSRTEAFKKVGRLPWRYIGAVAIVAAYVAFLPRTPVPPTATSMLVPVDVAVTSH
jgi:hypothetical protein